MEYFYARFPRITFDISDEANDDDNEQEPDSQGQYFNLG